MSPPVLGIDLGTSNSVVSVVEANRPTVIANQDGELTTASCVAFLPNGSVLVGNPARAGIGQRPERTVRSSKRLVGRTSSSAEVQKAQEEMSFNILSGAHGDVRVQIDQRAYRLEEIAAMILRELAHSAASYLGTTSVTKAVITVPAYFNDNQREATRNAAMIAGLEPLRILNEPTAAALAYGYGDQEAKRVAVYDFGGGTFDLSVLEMGAGVLEVLATGGDTYLGGDDMDGVIVDDLAEKILNKTGRDPRQDPAARAVLWDLAETSKRELSEHDTVEIDLEVVAGIPMVYGLTRNRFDQLIEPLIQRSIEICDSVLKEAKTGTHLIDGVVLVGGSTRVPAVREAVRRFFRREPDTGIDPDLVVSVGAAIYGASLNDQSQAQQILLDVTPLTLRLGTVQRFTEAIIEKNAPIPTERTRTFVTSRDHQEFVAIRVFQGESDLQADNTLLGEFAFGPLTLAPRGQVEIDVTFEIDPNGLVRVTATDCQTGRAASANVRLSVKMNDQSVAEASASLPGTAR
ncbi:MAG: molecular chaperone DnaK [Myxococcales bacterium]|nr:molecular chaperone DnaK [Myxococcales bacterium]